MSTPKIVWFALMGSILAYFGVSVYLFQPSDPPPEMGSTLPLAFGFIAVMEAGATFFIKRFLGNGFSGQILTWALCDSIAIYGLILAAMGYDSSAWSGFMMGGLALIYIHRPQ